MMSILQFPVADEEEEEMSDEEGKEDGEECYESF